MKKKPHLRIHVRVHGEGSAHFVWWVEGFYKRAPFQRPIVITARRSDCATVVERALTSGHFRLARGAGAPPL